VRLKEYRLRDSVDVLLSNCLKMSQEAQQRESKLPIKVVIVGDGSVGKTCLAQTFVHNAFPDDYTPTVFENMNKNMVVDGQEVFMELQDTAGQEEYEEIRKFGYSGAKVIIVGFAVNDQTTFENIKGKWLPELRDHAPEAKLLLVGTKSDLRTQKSKMSIKRRNRSARGKMVSYTIHIIRHALHIM